MKLFFRSKDGGPESTVWGYWLIEAKRFFSIALLKFVGKSREAYHSHAFDAVSWVLKGELTEDKLWFNDHIITVYKPDPKPIFTSRHTMHKVSSDGTTWVLTIRGPWSVYWNEMVNGKWLTLTHGRKVVA